MEMQWLVDGETLLVPGKNVINILQFDEEEGTWDRISEDKIFHASEISTLFSISNEVLVTYSDGDKVIKIWKMDDTGCSCQQEFKLKNNAIALRYDSTAKCLAVMYKDCKIGFIKRDFEINKTVKADSSHQS